MELVERVKGKVFMTLADMVHGRKSRHAPEKLVKRARERISNSGAFPFPCKPPRFYIPLPQISLGGLWEGLWRRIERCIPDEYMERVRRDYRERMEREYARNQAT